MHRTSSLLAGLLLAMTALAACTPSCPQVCNKLRGCELGDPHVSQDACVEDCRRQMLQAQDAGDRDRMDAFKEHRQCIGASTCDELAAGECYDERLYPF